MAEVTTTVQFPQGMQQISNPPSNTPIMAADPTTGQPGVVLLQTLQNNSATNIIGTITTASQAPTGTETAGQAYDFSDDILTAAQSADVPLTGGFNVTIPQGTEGGSIRKQSDGSWVLSPLKVNLSAYVPQSAIGTDVAAQSDVENIIGNNKLTEIPFSVSGSVYQTDGTTETVAGASCTAKTLVKQGDVISFGVNTTNVSGSTLSLLTKFKLTDQTFESVIVAASDHPEQFYEGSWTVDEDCYIALSNGTLNLATPYGKFLSQSNKLYVAPSDINNEQSGNGVPDVSTLKRMMLNNDFSSPYTLNRGYDNILPNSSISATSGAITTDNTKNLYAIIAYAGDVINWATHTGVGLNVYVVVSKTTGAVIASASNTSDGTNPSGSYTVTQDCIFYLSYLIATGTAASVTLTATNSSNLIYRSKVNLEDFNNFLAGARQTSDTGQTVVYTPIAERAVAPSSSVSGTYTVNATTSNYDVVLKTINCVVGKTYTLNWIIADPFGVYIPVPDGAGAFYWQKATVTVDNTAGTTTFTIPSNATASTLANGVLIQVSLSSTQVTYATWQNYTITGYGTTTMTVYGKLSGYSVSHDKLQSVDINIVTYSNNLDNKSGTVDFSSITQQALNELHQKGGGVLFFPNGKYILNNVIVPANVTVIGENMYNTIFYTTTGAAYITEGTVYFDSTAETKNVHMSNFTIDGSKVTATSYDVGYKGLYMLYLRNCTFRNIVVLNTGATGFGCDFFNNVTVDNITAINCGRLATSDQTPGASGIGIGTGDYDLNAVHSEVSSFSNLFALNCGQYGIFFEQQNGTYDSIGFKVVNAYAEGCRIGFGASGLADLIYTNCIAYANKEAGFSADSGSFDSGTASQRVTRRIVYNTCTASYNGVDTIDPTSTDYVNGNGFVIKGQQNTYGFTYNNCNVYGNKGDGFIAYNESDSNNYINQVIILGGTWQNNGRHGINFKNGTINKVVVKPSLVDGNAKNGINIDANLNQLMMTDMLVLDNQQYGVELVSGRTLTKYKFNNNVYDGNVTADLQNVAEN